MGKPVPYPEGQTGTPRPPGVTVSTRTPRRLDLSAVGVPPRVPGHPGLDDTIGSSLSTPRLVNQTTPGHLTRWMLWGVPRADSEDLSGMGRRVKCLAVCYGHPDQSPRPLPKRHALNVRHGIPRGLTVLPSVPRLGRCGCSRSGHDESGQTIPHKGKV